MLMYSLNNTYPQLKEIMTNPKENPTAVATLGKAMEAVGAVVSDKPATKQEYELVLMLIAAVDGEMERIRQQVENSMLTDKVDAFLSIANGH